jgi:hypothetical protein
MSDKEIYFRSFMSKEGLDPEIPAELALGKFLVVFKSCGGGFRPQEAYLQAIKKIAEGDPELLQNWTFKPPVNGIGKPQVVRRDVVQRLADVVDE